MNRGNGIVFHRDGTVSVRGVVVGRVEPLGRKRWSWDAHPHRWRAFDGAEAIVEHKAWAEYHAAIAYGRATVAA
jgi:hypothetical protein